MTIRTTVFLAEDHPVYREGLTRAIKARPDLELVGAIGDGAEALAEIRRMEPAVVILDVHLPGLDGNEILNALKRDGVPTRVLMLSATTDSSVVYEAVSRGASGYLSKDAEPALILDTVAAIARGETVLSDDVQRGLMDEVQLRAVDDRPVLTPREQEILRLIADGLSAPQVAQQLFLSTATVKTHLQHLYEKLGVSDRAAAVAVAMRRGLLE